MGIIGFFKWQLRGLSVGNIRMILLLICISEVKKNQNLYKRVNCLNAITLHIYSCANTLFRTHLYVFLFGSCLEKSLFMDHFILLSYCCRNEKNRPWMITTSSISTSCLSVSGNLSECIIMAKIRVCGCQVLV